MHHPTYRIAHTTAFVTPVAEHWLEREWKLLLIIITLIMLMIVEIVVVVVLVVVAVAVAVVVILVVIAVLVAAVIVLAVVVVVAAAAAAVVVVVVVIVAAAIPQCVHPMKDGSDDPSHHKRTLLPRSYISLLIKLEDKTCVWCNILVVGRPSLKGIVCIKA